MATRRKRLRHEEELEEQGLEPAREPEQEHKQEEAPEQERNAPAAAPPAARALALQQTAGNRAVGAALARWALPWVPMSAAATWPKEAQVIFDGKVLPLKSWSWATSSPRVGEGASGAGKAQFDEVTLTTALGTHSADLAQRTAQGDPIKTVIIVAPGTDGKGMTFTFTDVYITRYQLSGDLEIWTLSYAKKEYSPSPPEAQPRP